jgi:hypothetical protein
VIKKSFKIKVLGHPCTRRTFDSKKQEVIYWLEADLQGQGLHSTTCNSLISSNKKTSTIHEHLIASIFATLEAGTVQF